MSANHDGLFMPEGVTFAALIEQADDFEEISGFYRKAGKAEKADWYANLSVRFRKIAEVFSEDKPQVQE